jgi:hypothetical protein
MKLSHCYRCHQFCNPKDVRELDQVNTESCEQTFKWVNQYTAVKSMNQARFWFFFTVMFDLHNLQKQGNLRSIAHPKSSLRWELLPDQVDWEKTLLKVDVKVAEIETGMREVSIENDGSDSFVCDECGAKYKKPWTLKQHVMNKHQSQHKCEKCDLCFMDAKHLKDHMTEHNIYCSICDKNFANASSLTRHLKVHDKMIVCDYCKEVFNDKKRMKDHMKCHFVCQICKKNCETKLQFNQHSLMHK